MAVDFINNDTSFLPGIRLNVVKTDLQSGIEPFWFQKTPSFRHGGSATYQAYKTVQENPDLIGGFGEWDLSTIFSAEVFSYYEVFFLSQLYIIILKIINLFIDSILWCFYASSSSFKQKELSLLL
jgi:hypothetical protein